LKTGAKKSPTHELTGWTEGQSPVRIDRNIRTPHKIHDAKIAWPGSGERLVGGVWVGEALIGRDGSVHHVWTLRDIHSTPPWPEATDAIVAAVKQWRFTSTQVNGQNVPVCMAITVTIEMR
jgi:hypothetical protein